MSPILFLILGLMLALGFVFWVINRGVDNSWLLALRDFLGGCLLLAFGYALYLVL